MNSRPLSDEELLRRHLGGLNASSLRVFAILGTVLVPAFWTLDWYVIPEYVWLTAGVRALLAAYSATLLLLLDHRRALAERHVDWLAPSLTLLVAWSISLMCWLHEGYGSEYYAGINLTILGSGVLFLWSVRQAAAVFGAVYGFHMVPSLAGVLPIEDVTTTLNNQFFILSTAAVVMAAQARRFRLEVRDFHSNLSLERTKASLEDAYRRLEELDRMKTQFFNNITHELRTPLTLILSPLESMLAGDLGELTEAQKAHVTAMRRSAFKLLSLINNLLDLTKMEERFLRLRVERNDMTELLQEVVEYAQPLAARKAIELDLEVRARPSELHVDPEKMERVVVNLVSNALKFTDEGGHVRLVVDATDDEALIRVADDGAGIPPEKQAAIFERFSQGGEQVQERYGGTGIGLAFAREVVELHGGTIEIDSTEGQGSTFTLRLPQGTAHLTDDVVDRRTRDWSPAGGRREEDREPREWARELLRKKEFRFLQLDEATERRLVDRGDDRNKATKVLVVEDNVEILRFVHLQLQDLHAVYLARDGRQGLELARRERPDIVITDYMMPRMDGVELVRHLREDPPTADVPIVMLTARNELEDRSDARQAGADVYLGKPFSPRELRAAVDQLLARQGRQAGRVLQAQVRSLESISAGLAHEIRNPLSYVKNAYVVIGESIRKIDGALAEEDADRRRRKVERARERVDRMLGTADRGIRRIEQVVETVRRYAREGYPEEPSELTLDDSVQDVVALVAPRDERTVHLETDLAAEGARVRGIPEELHQAIRNLVQNAVDAVGSEGWVAVSTRPADDGVHLEVADDGPGISREVRERIFTPFYSTKEPGEGMGLGLAMVHRVVASMQGTIDVDSEVGRGTRFRIWLPRVDEEPQSGVSSDDADRSASAT